MTNDSVTNLHALTWDELHVQARSLDPPFRTRSSRDKLIEVMEERSKKQKLAHADFLQKQFVKDKEHIKIFGGGVEFGNSSRR